jgi:hypothetical protein
MRRYEAHHVVRTLHHPANGPALVEIMADPLLT